MLLATLKIKNNLRRRKVKFLVPRCPREKEFKIFSGTTART
jgi:hypothetical protein